MPTLRETILLLPEHELEGYPRCLETQAAGDLLASWLALWHPLVLQAAQAIPRWQHIDRLPANLENSLLVLPEFIQERASPQRREEWAAQGAWLCQAEGRGWLEFQDALLARFDLSSPLGLVSELRSEFAALGYGYLQIQLMTRQLRYTSNLDQLLFSEQVCKAVDAVLADDRETATRMLQSCFDSLGQERDHYYSLDVNLIDLTLLAPTTLGKSLQRQLDEATHATSLLANAHLLRLLEEKQPELAERLRVLQAEHRCCLVGGLNNERPHPLMPREAVVRELSRGKAAYRQLGFEPPTIFGRMSQGLLADSASMLKRANFSGALLIALGGGSYPQSSQVKLSWESADGVFITALAPPVLDAADSASFLSLGWTVGEALDHQHVPTVLFAHWPDGVCDLYPLLQIIASRTPALGRWKLLDEYFVDTDQPYHQERLDPDSFRYNWLAAVDNPAELIARTKAMHQCQSRCRALHNLLHLDLQLEHQRSPELVVSPASPADSASDGLASAKQGDLALEPAFAWSHRLAKLHNILDSLLDPASDSEALTGEFRTLATQVEQSVLASLGKKLVRRSKVVAAAQAPASAPARPCRLIINPRSNAVRWPVQLAGGRGLPADQPWYFASGRVGEHQYAAVDVPGLGFIASPEAEGAVERGRSAPLADSGGLLRNEFLEVQIDEARGHLRSLYIPSRRGNRLSVMLAYRERAEDGSFRYSDMIGSGVKMLTSSNMCGLQRATGRLELDGVVLGNFEIDYELWRGSRILEVIVKLTNLRPAVDANPWRSAYTLRLAWPTEAAVLRTFNMGTRTTWGGGRAISPELIEIDEVDYRTHYLTAGMAFHRRTEARFLETILACGDQTAGSHRCGIGVDLPGPLWAARNFMDEPYQIEMPEVAAPSTGWLLNVDVRDVSVDLEAPLVDAGGKITGMRLSVSETSGKSLTAKVRCWRGVASAARVDHQGGTLSKLTVDDDRITIALRANEQVFIDVQWQIEKE